MNFVDTAITLLHVTGQSMAVEDLCELALERDLFDKPGANPLRSMKARMTVELKKGRKSRLLKNDENVWRLRAGVKLPKGSDDVVAGLTKGKGKLKKTTAKTKAPAKADVKAKAPAKVVAKGKASAKTKTPAKSKSAEADKTKSAAASTKASPKKNSSSNKLATARPKKSDKVAKSSNASAAKKTAAEPSTEEVVELPPETLFEAPPVELSEEEKALVKLYGTAEGTMSATELNEYRDELTKDEDRPMLPEIRAERRPNRQRDRDRGGRKRRTRSDRDSSAKPERARRERSDRNDSREKRPEERKESNRRPSQGARDIAGTPIPAVSLTNAPGEALVRAAAVVLRTLPPGQSMPVRQLAQTMVRQGKLSGSADTNWRMVKGVLLVSEERRTTRGLEAIVRYHGKDLFSAGQGARRSAVDVASEALNKAAEEYAAAVENEMLSRLNALALPMLERIVHVYLQSTGWTDIDWVRRSGNSSYAIATPVDALESTMIAVRCGPEKVDRRGIGELRAGVYAKDLVAGLLIAPSELSEEAQGELAKEGSHVGVLCSRELIKELTAREVGVSRRHIQLPRIDQRFFDAVLS